MALTRPIPVWAFPPGYNPNLMGDRCERCRRSDTWEGRAIAGQDLVAWTCRCCTAAPQQIPD